MTKEQGNQAIQQIRQNAAKRKRNVDARKGSVSAQHLASLKLQITAETEACIASIRKAMQQANNKSATKAQHKGA